MNTTAEFQNVTEFLAIECVILRAPGVLRVRAQLPIPPDPQ